PGSRSRRRAAPAPPRSRRPPRGPRSYSPRYAFSTAGLRTISPGVPSAIRSPASRTTMRSEKRITARMMCSIMMIVMPCAFSRKRMVRMSSTSVLDSPAMASSEMSSFGRAAMARASSSLRISICVSPAGRRCAFASSPMVFKISPASVLPSAPARPAPAYSSGMPRFSSTVMLVKGLGIWKVRTMPSRVRWCGGSAVISRPSKRIVPPLTGSTPETQLMSVVLPDPFGPKPPKRLTSPCTSSSAWAIASAASQAPHQAEDPLGRQDDEGDEHDAHDEQIHLGGNRHRRELLGRPQQDSADHRADPARGAADHRHGQRVHGIVEREGGVGLDEGHVVGERRAGDAEQEAADGGGEELEPQCGDAHALGRLLVVPQRRQPAADPVSLDEPRHKHSDAG